MTQSNKLRVNDPCPCGSGKKYKKCCMRSESMQSLPAIQPPTHTGEWEQVKAHLMSSSPTLPSDLPKPRLPSKVSTLPSLIAGRSDKTAPTWAPLRQPPPQGAILRIDELRYLNEEHIAFQRHIERLAQRDTPESCQQAIQQLNAIPHDIAYKLEWVGSAKSYLYLQLDQREEALLCQIEQMFLAQDEILWFLWGMRGLQWLQQSPTKTISPLLDRLRQTLQAQPFVVPQLLLAFGQRRIEEANQTSLEPSTKLYLEALHIERWPWKNKQTSLKRAFSDVSLEGEWLGAIADSFSRLLHGLVQTNQQQTIPAVSQMFHRFPWEALHPRYRELTFRAMGATFASLKQDTELQRLCERFASITPHSPFRWFWLGVSAQQRNKISTATRYFLKATQTKEQLTDQERLHILDFLYQQGEYEQANALLKQVNNPDTPNAIKMRYWDALLQQEYPQALALADTFLAMHPNDFLMQCHRIRLLDRLEHNEQLQQQLYTLSQSTTPQQKWFAHIYLGILHTTQGEPDAARAIFQKLPKILPDGLFFDTAFQATCLLCQGHIHEHYEEWTQANEAYQQAIILRPDGMTYARRIISLCQQERWEDANQFLQEALTIAPQHPAIQYARFLLHNHHGHPEDIKESLEELGKSFFDQLDQRTLWLQTWLWLHIEQEEWHEAFALCELYLEDFLATPTLRELRTSFLAGFLEHVRTLESIAGQRTHELTELKHTLRNERHRQKSQREVLAQALRSHAHLKNELRQLQQDNTQPDKQDPCELNTFVSIHKDVLDRVPSNALRLLKSAQKLWLQLANTPQDDHGPVILQLARVIEAEANRRIIDPMVQIAQQQDIPLHTLPTTRPQHLKPSDNRLSLGEVASFCYTNTQESSLLPWNPYSSKQHQKALELFRATPAFQRLAPSETEYLQIQWIVDLKTLATARNKASHAGSPLARSEAEKIYSLIWGADSSKGMLAYLVQLTPSR